MTPEEAAAALEPIKAKAIELASTALQERSVYLLSELGAALGNDLRTLKIITRGGLVDFVRTHMSDRFQLILTGKHSNIYAIIPVEGAQAAPVSAVRHERETEQKPRHPRYHYRFWAAFSVPPSGEMRFLKLSDFTFDDLDESQPEPPNSLPIPTELIAPEEVEHRDELIASNINRWLEGNKLAPDQFLASAKRWSPASQVAPLGTSVLDILISSLDRRQLQSSNLSLDVIATLLRKRI